MKTDYLIDGPEDTDALLILAHGAGQGMASPFMADIARLLADGGVRVVRFNFPYMQQSLASGTRRPPNPQAKLLAQWHRVIADFRLARRLFIGGKSMGGRMASLIADEAEVHGLVCLGYPFHPPGRPDNLRTAHLAQLQTPTLICQGERDTFGRREEVEKYALAPTISCFWLPEADHSLKPRKASGFTRQQHLAAACGAVIDFIQPLVLDPPVTG